MSLSLDRFFQVIEKNVLPTEQAKEMHKIMELMNIAWFSDGHLYEVDFGKYSYQDFIEALYCMFDYIPDDCTIDAEGRVPENYDHLLTESNRVAFIHHALDRLKISKRKFF